MKQWMVLYRKEMLEMWRSAKWLWIPVVFIILGVMNPISSYYMPQILEAAGGLPEGTVIDIPIPSASEVLAKTLSQYNTLGILIIVLAFMGAVAAERTSGIAAMILVKPVRYVSYLTAKWAGMLSLTAVSFLIGYLTTWYYTEQLIGSIEIERVIASGLMYLVWLAFVLTVTTFMGAWLKGGGAIAFVTILIAAALSISTGLFSKFMAWSPSRLSDHAGAMLATGEPASHFVLALSTSFILMAAMMTFGVYVLKGQELTE